ncbi:MAG: family 16 glycosylhydrolase [Armatimonadia bacterium]
MKPSFRVLSGVLLPIAIWAATAQAQNVVPKGDVALPAQCVVFGPFAREDGVPAPELLRRVPETLVIGDKRVMGRTAAFDARRCLDCAPFCGAEVGNTAWVYLTFAADKAGPATFGFGADWWYEAYLDGKLISETLSRDQGNEVWPPSIHDFAATVELTKGDHVLALRMVRGSGSAILAVGGPLDLKNPAITKAPTPASAQVAKVTKAGYREGPPAGKKWKLVWNDEFDGTTLDTKKWNVQPESAWEWPGFKTSPSRDNLFLDGQGSLVLQLTRDPDGTVRHFGSINSFFEKAYGYFETRVQFSRQPGWWSAVWMAGYPYDCGVDGFVNSQEFDIFEDFYKPKKENDISHCYHCAVKLTRLDDQGNAKGVGEGGILGSTRLGRTSSGRKAVMEQYEGWHTVGFQWTPLEHIFYVDGQETLRQTYREVPMTNVPQKLWISGCLRTPKTEKERPFYGRLEDAQLPDRLVVDYVRVYDQDTGARKLPAVTLAVKGKGPFKEGEPVSFDVSATASRGKVKSIMLFSMGRVRAEQKVDATKAKATFTVTNLFPGATNTIIAMAQDDAGLIGQSAPIQMELMTGKEYTGTPFQGKPQAIPGTVRGGYYDEGGNGVAFRSSALGPSDARLEWRKTEIGAMEEAVEVGGDRARWICYEVEVAQAGEYEAELFMNRPDYSTKGLKPEEGAREGTIRLCLGETGVVGPKLVDWKLPASWNSGAGWRTPQTSVGKQTVQLPAGRHKLIMFFDGFNAPFTFFCKLVVSPVVK